MEATLAWKHGENWNGKEKSFVYRALEAGGGGEEGSRDANVGEL